jgi:hypothetical protein
MQRAVSVPQFFRAPRKDVQDSTPAARVLVGLSAAAGCDAGAPAGCLGATGGFETFFVANSTVTAIPEPETYALMLAGLALVGWMAKRRPMGD